MARRKLKHLIQQAIESANTAYQNSGISTRLRLVHTLEVAYTESPTASANLAWVKADPTIAAARNTYQADIVPVIVSNAAPTSCGTSSLMANVDVGFQSLAFSVIERECAVGNLSFAHEIAHVQGCLHNREDAGSITPAYPYAYGHYDRAANFRTIMTYENPCPSCPRLPYFSNPNVTVNGVQSGIADQRDNARVINNTANTVANFRQSIIQTTAAIQFSEASYRLTEYDGIIPVQVTRSGATSAATVEYITNDDQRLFNCNPQTAGVPGGAIAGVATARCDYSSTVGTLSFAAGETSKTINIPLSDDAHVEGVETFTISLRNAAGATLGAVTTSTITINDNDAAGQANPISGNPFFVRQHYLDFFGRNPNQSEVDSWVRVTGADCSLDAPDACYDRIWISGKGFFESTEFQQKGYFAYRFYKTLGASRLPTYNEFVPDMVSLLGTGEADKNQFAQRFMARADYAALYPTTQTNDQFVDKLVQQTGLSGLDTAAMKANLNNNSKTRVQVLREVVESAQMNSREYTNAWVVMQYFGYLRRDGAASEYQAWKSYLDANPTKWRQMINAFVNSTEYRQRFGDPNK